MNVVGVLGLVLVIIIEQRQRIRKLFTAVLVNMERAAWQDSGFDERPKWADKYDRGNGKL